MCGAGLRNASVKCSSCVIYDTNNGALSLSIPRNPYNYMTTTNVVTSSYYSVSYVTSSYSNFSEELHSAYHV